MEEKEFTQVSSSILNNEELRLEEKGILCILSSIKDGELLYEKDIISISQNGRDATKSILRGLEEKGYVNKVDVAAARGKKGKFAKGGGISWELTSKYKITSNQMKSTYLPETSNQVTDNKDTVKPASATEPIKQIERKKFFFNVGEKPTQERVVQFAEEKGYPKEVGARIHSNVLLRNFKDKNGTEIKYMDSYLSLLLKNESKEPPIKQEALIEVEKVFVEKVDSINRRYVAGYKNKNSKHDIQSGLLSMKDAAKLFFRTVGRTEGEYENRIVKYMESGGGTFLSPHGFKKFIQGNTEEIIQPSIGENEREDKFIYVKKDASTEEIEKKGTSYLDRWKA